MISPTARTNLLIKIYRFALEDGRLCARGQRTRIEDLVTPQEREAIAEELERRVVPFQPCHGGGQPDLDPWRHALPGLERMTEARMLLAQWRKKYFPVRVVQGASVMASDPYNAQTYAAPFYLKMELLWLLREEVSTDWFGQRLPSPSSGGAA